MHNYIIISIQCNMCKVIVLLYILYNIIIIVILYTPLLLVAFNVMISTLMLD